MASSSLRCPNWKFRGKHTVGLNHTSVNAHSVSWQGQVSKSHHLSTGVPQGLVVGPLLFSIHTTSLARSSISIGFPITVMQIKLYLSFHPDDTISAQISACLSDISVWIRGRHLQPNLSKTELLVFPANPAIQLYTWVL